MMESFYGQGSEFSLFGKYPGLLAIAFTVVLAWVYFIGARIVNAGLVFLVLMLVSLAFISDFWLVWLAAFSGFAIEEDRIVNSREFGRKFLKHWKWAALVGALVLSLVEVHSVLLGIPLGLFVGALVQANGDPAKAKRRLLGFLLLTLLLFLWRFWVK